ncbi:DUF6453 family protein [Enterobacter hormaechei]|uniref:DUF6453 family protein n=1 Tax=Enterobacter hormaechei TaxID=158836 RepID=UPI000F81A33E|nr:DUF6453 family protein [Enterobacter hormaechei]RTN53670.1 hypothetical protein EKN89_25050 [Enterobacter hormaechei]
MARGLYIDLNDGRPAMTITAGMKCPSYGGEAVEAWGQQTMTVQGYVAGATPFFIPSNSVVNVTRSPNLITTIMVLDGITNNGNGTLTQRVWSSDGWGKDKTFPGTVWQILPAGQSGNRGLLIEDSTDFIAITDVSRVASCVFSGTVNVNGTYALPAKGLVFARWNDSAATLECDGNNIYSRQDYKGYDDIARSVNVDIAIFAVQAPVPGRGLNFINAAGQCTFSTTRRPFIFRNQFYSPGNSWVDIGNSMIALGCYGFNSSTASGWCNMRSKGLVMSGNSVKCGNGRVRSRWTDKYSVTGERYTGMSIPVIPAMY